MVNGPIHEWESDAGTEAGQQSNAGRWSGAGDLSPGSRRRESQRELTDAIPALKSLARQEPMAPSSAQWAAFSRQLSAKLDEETKRPRMACWRASVRDRLSATDSRTVRAGVVAAATAVLAAVLAALIWIISQLAPAPAAPAAAWYVPPPALITARA